MTSSNSTKLQASFVTIVDDVALRSSIRLWARTTMLRPAKGQDLYLLIIAHATQLPYEEVLGNYERGDTGLQAARRKTKRIIFARLCADPSYVLQVHAEIVVDEPATVELGHGPQAAENHSR